MPWTKSGFRFEFDSPEEREEYWKKQPLRLPPKMPLDRFPGLNEDHIWGVLHDRYNTAPMVIQDKQAWFNDVIGIIQIAEDVDEVHAELAKRQKERLDELVTGINNTDRCWSLALTPRRFEMRRKKLEKLVQRIGCFHENGTLVDALHMLQQLEKILLLERKQTWEDNEEAMEHERNQPSPVSAEPNAGPSTTEHTADGAGKRKRQDSEPEGSRDKKPRTATSEGQSCATKRHTGGAAKRKRDDVDPEAGPDKRPRGMTPPKEASQGEASQGEASQGQTSQGETSQGQTSHEASSSTPPEPADKCEASGPSVSHGEKQPSMTPATADAGPDGTSPAASPPARPTDAGPGPSKTGTSPAPPPMSDDRCEDSESTINPGKGKRVATPSAGGGPDPRKRVSFAVPPMSDDEGNNRNARPSTSAAHASGSSARSAPRRNKNRRRAKATRTFHVDRDRPLSSFKEGVTSMMDGDKIFYPDQSFRCLVFPLLSKGSKGLGYIPTRGYGRLDRAVREIMGTEKTKEVGEGEERGERRETQDTQETQETKETKETRGTKETTEENERKEETEDTEEKDEKVI